MRESKGLTREYVSERSGISVTHLNSIENGYQNIKVNHLKELALVFECGLDDIWAEAEIQRKNTARIETSKYLKIPEGAIQLKDIEIPDSKWRVRVILTKGGE